MNTRISNRPTTCLALVLLVAACLPSLAADQSDKAPLPTTTPLESSTVNELLNYLEQNAQDHGAEAFAAFAVREGSLTAQTGYGLDQSTPLPMDSMREPLESLLIARLIFQGKLDWNWKANRIYGRFSIGGTNQEATLKQLLDNTAGIPSEADKRFEDDWFGPADTFAILQQTSAMAPAGDSFASSRLSSLAATMLAVYAVSHDDQTLAEDTRSLLLEQVGAPIGLSSLEIDSKRDSMKLSLNDLSKWLRSEMLIAQAPDGLMFARASDITRRWAPAEWTRKNQAQGYGWHTHNYRDLNIIARGGNAGKNARMIAGFIPKEQLAFAVWVQGGAPDQINTLIEELPLALVEMMRQPQ